MNYHSAIVHNSRFNDYFLKKCKFELNGQDIPRAGEELNKCDGEVFLNVDVGGPKIGAVADVKLLNADELKGVDEVPKPVLKVEPFDVKGLEGVAVEKGLASDWPKAAEGANTFVWEVVELKPVDWGELSGPPKFVFNIMKW